MTASMRAAGLQQNAALPLLHHTDKGSTQAWSGAFSLGAPLGWDGRPVDLPPPFDALIGQLYGSIGSVNFLSFTVGDASAAAAGVAVSDWDRPTIWGWTACLYNGENDDIETCQCIIVR